MSCIGRVIKVLFVNFLFFCQVIEVNSSTKRGGKYILSEFQEATQSHQVSRKRHEKEQEISSSLTSEKHGNSKTEKVSSSGRKGSKKNKDKKKEIGKNKTEEIPSQNVEIAQVKMSLILLDEVCATVRKSCKVQ